MSETTNSLIPKAGVIEVPDPPTITAVEFIKQVIENINEQISPLDQEVYKASFGDTSFVSLHFLYLFGCLSVHPIHTQRHAYTCTLCCSNRHYYDVCSVL